MSSWNLSVLLHLKVRKGGELGSGRRWKGCKDFPYSKIVLFSLKKKKKFLKPFIAICSHCLSFCMALPRPVFQLTRKAVPSENNSVSTTQGSYLPFLLFLPFSRLSLKFICSILIPCVFILVFFIHQCNSKIQEHTGKTWLEFSCRRSNSLWLVWVLWNHLKNHWLLLPVTTRKGY